MENLNIYNNLPETLTEEEINVYFKKLNEGDKEARKQIIIHNMRLVKWKAQKFVNCQYDFDDIFEHGVIGLIKSVDSFDLSKNNKFATYAAKCIENEILMFIRRGKKYINDISLDQAIAKDNEGSELKLEDILEDINSDFVSECVDNESYKVIRKIINELPEIEKYIAIRYFGFIDNKPMKQKEIADELGITQSYVSRIIKRIIKKISAELEILGIIEISRKNKKGEKNMARKLRTIYECLKYPREQIDEMLSKLTDKEKKLVFLRNGEDLDHPVTSKEWNEEYSKQYYGCLIPKMKRLLENPEGKRKKYVRKKKKTEDSIKIVNDDTNNKLDAKIEEDQTQFTKNNLKEKQNEKEEYIKVLELLKTANFGQMLNVLTPKEAIIICLKLGYVDGKYFSTESISNFLGIEKEEVIESTKKVLLLYKDSINEFIDKAVEYTTEQENPNSLFIKLHN